MLSACTRQEPADFCDNHYLFHESHLDSIGSLKLTHSSDGTVRTEFSLPVSLFEAQSIEQLSGILNESDKVFSLQSAVPCVMKGNNVTSGTDLVVANYEMECGADVRIRQIDVLLFDIVDELDEIVAHITTPATQKRFAINRRCDSAIFRLQTRSDR